MKNTFRLKHAGTTSKLDHNNIIVVVCKTLHSECIMLNLTMTDIKQARWFTQNCERTVIFGHFVRGHFAMILVTSSI